VVRLLERGRVDRRVRDDPFVEAGDLEVLAVGVPVPTGGVPALIAAAKDIVLEVKPLEPNASCTTNPVVRFFAAVAVALPRRWSSVWKKNVTSGATWPAAMKRTRRRNWFCE
jgi:hypothetical protein